MREMRIGDRWINDDEPAWVIAEIGNNHGGDPEMARKLIKMAAANGADAVKFQTRDNRNLFTAAAYDAPYHSENAYGPTYGSHRDALELRKHHYLDLKVFAESLGLVFFSTPFDPQSADFLQAINVPCFKIASGDLTNLPLLRHVAAFGKPVIVSTGGGTLDDVRRVVERVPWKPGQLALLQCTATYPAQADEMNLRVIADYRRQFPGVVVGLSDHFNGIVSGPLAFMLGARVFEKHVTLSHAMKGTDHVFSLEPNGLRRFVRDLHRTPGMLGDGLKHRFPSETPGIVKMSKAVYAARALPSGHVLTEDDLILRSPGGGIPPYQLDGLIGRTLSIPVAAEEMLSFGYVE